MKIKLSLKRAEGIALLTALPDCYRFLFWSPKAAIERNPDKTIHKIFIVVDAGEGARKYTITPEIMMRGANLAIQPEAELNEIVKDTIKAGDFFAANIVLDTIVQFGLFGRVVFK